MALSWPEGVSRTVVAQFRAERLSGLLHERVSVFASFEDPGFESAGAVGHLAGRDLTERGQAVIEQSFGGDQSRVRRGHADANFSILRRTALRLLKNNKTLSVGVKNRRLTAAWDDDYLQQVLFGQ